ncbi:uncharacterized protein LOC131684505 [Topomyia yanbarensis]|uniref:uncharacterized protein LOC131684505 n=1 Tax=Topomyia yanbarensis TaxID=2498891 RepID=UPI00273B5DF8|nr:uncharacterized protein LOC131684505 [Topomyia yanbarensis]
MIKLASISVLVGLLLRLVITSAKLFPCDRIQNGRICYIQNITIDLLDDHRTIQFQDVLQLIIDSCSIPLFSRDLFGSLKETNFLTLKGGDIQAINFSSETLHSLRIDKTELTNLTIAAVPNHNLNTLMINRNPIVTLPNTFRYLFALSILDLSQNRLRHISLDWFQQMDNLLILDVSRNHIARIDGSSDLRLHRLKNFWANHNQLTQIPWFPIGFPKLERVRLSNNYWSCNWIRSTRQQIWDRDIRLFDADDGACSVRSEGGLCCYDSVPPVTAQAKYELLEIDFHPQQEEHQSQQQQEEIVFEVARMQSRSREDQELMQKDTCETLHEAVRALEREKVLSIREKTEMEQQFVKKVASLQEILRGVREDLEESEKEVSRYRLKERLDMIARTNNVKQNRKIL